MSGCRASLPRRRQLRKCTMSADCRDANPLMSQDSIRGLNGITRTFALAALWVASAFAGYTAIRQAWAQQAAIYGTYGFSYVWIAKRWLSGDFWGGVSSYWSPLFPAMAVRLQRAGGCPSIGRQQRSEEPACRCRVCSGRTRPVEGPVVAKEPKYCEGSRAASSILANSLVPRS